MKRVLLVRHAEAEPKKVGQKDLERRLTPDGQKDSRRVGKGLQELCDGSVCIISSKAVRAIQTAEGLAKEIKCDWRIETDGLNPGCGKDGFRAALAEAPKEADTVVLVGHEPDLSEMVGGAIGSADIRLRFKKLACAVVGWDDLGKTELIAFIPPKIATKLGGG